MSPLATWLLVTAGAAFAGLPAGEVPTPAAFEEEHEPPFFDGSTPEPEEEPEGLPDFVDPAAARPFQGLYLGEIRYTQAGTGMYGSGSTTVRMRTWAVCDEADHPIRPAKFAWVVGDTDTYARIERGNRRAAWTGRAGLGLAALGITGLTLSLSGDDPKPGLILPLFVTSFTGLGTAILAPKLAHNHQKWFPHYYTPERAGELLGASPEARDEVGATALPERLPGRYQGDSPFVRCRPGVDLSNVPAPVRR
jgi:hypothetical protein